MYDLVYENKNRCIRAKMDTLARAVRSWYALYDLNEPTRKLADTLGTIITLYDQTRRECERKILISFGRFSHEHELYRDLYADICHDLHALKRVFRLYEEIYYSACEEYADSDCE